MKKQHSLFYSSLLFLAATCFSCTENIDNNRAYFSINPSNRFIVFSTWLNDSIAAKLAFDTGCSDCALYLDSSFVAAHPALVTPVLPDTSLIRLGWTHDPGIKNLSYNIPQTIKAGKSMEFIHNTMYVFNWKKAIQSDVSDGIFNIPKHDTTHIWELNFEHNYLEIHPTDNYTMPENCYIASLDDSPLFSVTLPLQITCANGDTITINQPFFIDSGMAWDVALVYPAKEIEFFHQQDNAVWTCYKDSYFRHYTVSAKLPNSIVMDSLRIYTHETFRPHRQYLIGLNFLKRFNVFFDRKIAV